MTFSALSSFRQLLDLGKCESELSEQIALFLMGKIDGGKSTASSLFGKVNSLSESEWFLRLLDEHECHISGSRFVFCSVFFFF